MSIFVTWLGLLDSGLEVIDARYDRQLVVLRAADDGDFTNVDLVKWPGMERGQYVSHIGVFHERDSKAPFGSFAVSNGPLYCAPKMTIGMSAPWWAPWRRQSSSVDEAETLMLEPGALRIVVEGH